MSKPAICPHCHGTGKLESPQVIGGKARKRREAAGLALKDVAARMEVSAPYLSDMELGKRRFTPAQMRRFEAAIRALSR